MANELSRPNSGLTVRQAYGGGEISRTAETAVSAAAAQAEAQVKAMYSIAVMRPRDLMMVREKLLNDCERRGFAEAAEYTIPRGGKKITGPSIRFAEAALRAMGNVHVQTSITYEDDERRVGTVSVIDLEANVPLTAGFTIEKTVERRKVSDKDVVVRERTNSNGQTVYVILASEADVLMKQESIVSRLRRNLILQLLPGDLRDEAIAQCHTTLRREDENDPGAAAKRLADAFFQLGVPAAQIRDFLGHNVDRVTLEELQDLRGIYSAMKDGSTTWSQVMESRREEKPPAQSEGEKREKAALIGEIATARVQEKDRYEAALTECGVPMSAAASSLPIETLRKIAALLHGEAPESIGEAVEGVMDGAEGELPDFKGDPDDDPFKNHPGEKEA